MELVKMLFGSRLYGTATAESDTDYKGVFMPTKKDILLGKVPKCINTNTKKSSADKNTCDDIDTEIYSLQYFIALACEGQTVALDMLHAPNDMIISSHPIWENVVKERHRFYTRNLKAFIGYARKQAAKYGIKGSRLNEAKTIVELLSSKEPTLKLESFWDELPSGEHLHFIEPNPNGIPQYQVCGKTLQASQRVDYTLNIINTFYKAYGQRALQAAKNEGIDWKAISHAVRAAMQVKEILTDNTITFPLKSADIILAIKNGQMDYTAEAAPLLESLMDEVEALSKKSKLPKKVNRGYWDSFLLETIEEYVL